MEENRYQKAKSITLVGVIMSAFLAAIKLFGGVLSHSHALIADGIHSFADFLTDLMVVFASKYGSLDADATHPYGHQRIETAATLMLALLLCLAGAGIIWDAAHEISHAVSHKPGWLALPIALLSILVNEILFHLTYYVGKNIHSSLILANAWHHRSDAASSIIVALGLIGARLGFIYLDAVAALIVGLIIIKMGVNYAWNSVKELIDTAAEPELIKKIEDIIQSIPGVEKIHQLRSRFMGADLFVDVHILVSPYISVSEGHYIAQHVHRALTKELPCVKDVTVHVDPEDDEVHCPSLFLPNRKQLEENLILPWKENYPTLLEWIIHYLDGKMTIDLIFSEELLSWTIVCEQIQSDIASYPFEITLRFFNQKSNKENKV